MASKIAYNLQDVNLGRKGLNECNAEKTQLVSFDYLNNYGNIGVKMCGSVLDENSSSKMLSLFFSSKLDQGYYSVSVFLRDSFYEVSFF